VDLARRLGITWPLIVGGWERGTSRPPWPMVLRLATLLRKGASVVARNMGWTMVPGDRCACGCAGFVRPPTSGRGWPNDCKVEVKCRACGKPRLFSPYAPHDRLCVTCSNKRRTGKHKVPRFRYICVGYDYFGEVRFAQHCQRTREFTPGQITKSQTEGSLIDPDRGLWRCKYCTRANNMSKGDIRFLTELLSREAGSRPRGVRKPRIQSDAMRRETRSALLKSGRIPHSGRIPPSRRGAQHRPDSKRRLGMQSTLRPWRRQGGALSVELRLCQWCGLLLMVERERLNAGKRGHYHRRCSDEWRRQVGIARADILGKPVAMPRPKQRERGRKGRIPAPDELKRYFRWLMLYQLGRHLGENVSYRTLADLMSAETHEMMTHSRIQYGIASIAGRLPPLWLANEKFRICLRALRDAGLTWSDAGPAIFVHP
jgi:hypothetical protein